jgi:hypothetical protein
VNDILPHRLMTGAIEPIRPPPRLTHEIAYSSRASLIHLAPCSIEHGALFPSRLVRPAGSREV